MFANLVGLYGVQIAGVCLPLATVPYLARVLGPEAWGLAMFFQALGLWLSVAIEYGFNLAGSRDVARARGAGEPLGGIVSGILGAKLLLAAGAIVIAAGLALAVPVLRAHSEFLVWTLLYTLALGFSPFWYFQGIERMAPVAAVEVASRAAATAGAFVCIRTSQDGPLWMALQAGAATASTAVALVLMFRESGCGRLDIRVSLKALREGMHMTFFRAATTLGASANLLVLGFLGQPLAVGFFGGAEKLARAESTLLSPVSQVAYPRIASLIAADHARARGLATRAATMSAGLAVTGALFAALAAPLLVRLALGPQFAGAVASYRVLQLWVPLAVLRNAIGMNWLLPSRLERAAGTLVFGGLLANALLAIWLGMAAGAEGIAWAAVISEALMLLGCLVLAWPASLSSGRQERCR